MDGRSSADEPDLYGLLGVSKTASPEEIKKAYKKLALLHHPDKVAQDKRAESEDKFKDISKAYEILKDDEKRHLYDEYGMAGVEGRMPMGGGGGMEDLLSQMFGMGPMGGHGHGGPQRPRRGPDEEQPYKATLEELYKGKTVKFAAEREVICGQCNGSGAKDKVKPNKCDRCKGAGRREVLRQIGPILQPGVILCDHCEGTGMYYKEKDRCKKCKGKRTVKETKALELYIPRGSMQGDRIVLEGEADQIPDAIAGNLIFQIVEEPHDRFTRIGADLSADLNVTLAEALGGFSRVVITHLDGRGIHIDHPRGKILRPGQVLKVPGEGMPMKRGDSKGDLYLIAKIEFPKDGWLADDADYQTLAKLLPGPSPPIKAEEVDEVDYEDDADIEQMGARSGDSRGHGGDWEDEEEEGEGPQCATQ